MNIIKYNKEESIMERPNLDLLANMIIKYVKKHNIHILRYNAKSSESIYLKFDYGLAGTLRISAHLSKSDLNYTFNLIKGLLEPYTESIKKDNTTIYRYYYTEKLATNLAKDIVRYKEYRQNKYGEQKYKNLLSKKANYSKKKLTLSEKQKNITSFWHMSTEV